MKADTEIAIEVAGVVDFIKALYRAGERFKNQGTEQLEAFADAVTAFTAFARANNAPTSALEMLAELLGDIADLSEGRPAKYLLKRVAKGSRTSVQKEALWAAAAVSIDLRGGTEEACIEAERMLKRAGCPLPTKPTTGTEVPGLSLKNWRKQRRSGRRSGLIDELLSAHRSSAERLISTLQLSREQASAIILETAIETFGQ